MNVVCHCPDKTPSVAPLCLKPKILIRQDDKQDLLGLPLSTCLKLHLPPWLQGYSTSLQVLKIFFHIPSHLSALTDTTSVPRMFWFYRSDKCLFFFPNSAKITSPIKPLLNFLSWERLTHSFLYAHKMLCPLLPSCPP